MGWLTADSGYLSNIVCCSRWCLYLLTPSLLAFTAAKKVQSQPVLAVAIAMALVSSYHSSCWCGRSLSVSWIPVILSPSGYTSSVIPIILAVWVQSKLEPFVKKVIPQFLQMILVPLVVLVVMVPLTFLLLGPIRDGCR